MTGNHCEGGPPPMPTSPLPLREALDAYRANPIDARDRPASWRALAALLDACDAALAATPPARNPTHLTTEDIIAANQRPVSEAPPMPDSPSFRHSFLARLLGRHDFKLTGGGYYFRQGGTGYFRYECPCGALRERQWAGEHAEGRRLTDEEKKALGPYL